MDTSKVNRVEIINHGNGDGRVFSYWESDGIIKVEAILQDDERTLKIFISKK